MDTQTNWNGILGEFQLEATPKVYIDRVRVFHDIHKKQAIIKLSIEKKFKGHVNGYVTIETQSTNSIKKQTLNSLDIPFSFSEKSTQVEVVIDMGDEMQLWDEFNPALYESKIVLDWQDQKQIVNKRFGMVEFLAGKDQFIVNGKSIFLRGTNDCCVFPLSGYAPMTEEEWISILKTARAYGINHYRFHSWCPPEAALAAADVVGVYLQPELPCWGALAAEQNKIAIKDANAIVFGLAKHENQAVYDPRIITEAEKYFTEEAKQIFDQYGDHPSFRMFAIGNELHGSKAVMKRMVDGFREYDNARRLYAQGSNNFYHDSAPGESDDYWTTFRTSKRIWDNYDNNVRGSYSFYDQKDGGVINHFYPSTRIDFSKALAGVDLPVIGHEPGQYQYYPDFAEIVKYTGVTKPWNLEIARSILEEKGILEQAPDFFKAAGHFASILYCADMEMQIRTPNFAGFQLLDIKDYPGQGTALVGPLNAFMESKGTISPEKWREFCNPVTILAGFDSYVATSGDIFKADIKIANFGSNAIDGKTLKWSIEGITEGNFTVNAPQGEICLIGEIQFKIPRIETARRVNLNLLIEGTDIKKSYPLWFYPRKINIDIPKDIIVARVLSSQIVSKLLAGAKILLIPDHKLIEKISVDGLFITDFWSTPMFRDACIAGGVKPSAGTLGLLIDQNHPALSGFPTEFHSNWQWWLPVKNSRPIVLDDTPIGYKPIVQTIDNVWRSHKLGTLFEFKAGKGKLFVCAVDLPGIQNKPEGRMLYYSILEYMKSDDFNPSDELSRDSKLWKVLNRE